MPKFTEDDVYNECQRRYAGPIACNTLVEACREPTLKDAVDMVLCDTVMWESSTGNPFDPEIWKRISK